MDASKVIVLITGANQGIGFETARNLLLSDSKYHVLLASRNIQKGVAAISSLLALDLQGSVELLTLDVTNDSSIESAANFVESTYGRLDVLVNNAGIGAQNAPPIDAMRKVYEVNVFAPVSITEAFLPLLRKSMSPRLIFVSSTTGSITHASDPNSPLHGGGAMDYRSSKTALNMLMVLYWNKLKDGGFMVHGANPGLIATNFHGAGRRPGAEPEVGGERIASVVKGERDSHVGRVWGANGVLPW